ncbi:kinase-like domain-containing protein [Globomyces pollinis-pini]|nr:kinase-like domain-containing protein [Globomyces pollinis-pini]
MILILKRTLSQNSLTGYIPNELGSLKSMYTLNLVGNKLSGGIPPLLAKSLYFSSFQFDEANKNVTDPFSNPAGVADTIMNVYKTIGYVIAGIVLLVILCLFSICIRGRMRRAKLNKQMQQLPRPPSHYPTVANAGHVNVYQQQPVVYNQPIATPIHHNGNHMYNQQNVLPIPQQPNNVSVNSNNTLLNRPPDSRISSNSNLNTMVQSATQSTMYDVRLSILKKIAGSGGVGNVYLAVYDQKQAVAKIPIDPEHENLVYEESRLMSKLRSPWTVESLAFMADAMIVIPDQPDGRRTALIIEFMNLGSFSTYLTPEVPLNLKDDYHLVNSKTLELLIQVARGLEFMHSNSFVHLDLKPDNILLHKTGTSVIAKLSDFGSTRPNGSEDAVFQTKGYIPPEARYSPKKTEKYDIYAFGNILINVLTKSNVNVWWGFDKAWTEKEVYLRQYITNHTVLNIIMACIQDDPNLRLSSADLVMRLSACQQGDFEVVPIAIENSKIPNSVMLQPPSPANAFASSNSSTPFKCTAGEFLFKQLELRSPISWNQFQESFKTKFVPDQAFDFDRLKLKIKPVANQVTSKSISYNLFNDVSPLGYDEDEEAWIEQMLEEISLLMEEYHP